MGGLGVCAFARQALRHEAAALLLLAGRRRLGQLPLAGVARLRQKGVVKGCVVCAAETAVYRHVAHLLLAGERLCGGAALRGGLGEGQLRGALRRVELREGGAKPRRDLREKVR